jgi:hypothetical protein
MIKQLPMGGQMRDLSDRARSLNSYPEISLSLASKTMAAAGCCRSGVPRSAMFSFPVLHYDRGRGQLIRRRRLANWLNQILGNEVSTLQTREPGTALELIDRYLLRTLNLQAVRGREETPRKIAVIIDFAEFVVPRGDPIQLSGPFSANVVKVLGWANDPAILH